MSMMRLLSASRSLIGGRRPGKRLQMVDVRSLPKFGPRGKTSKSKLQPSVKDQNSSITQERAEKAPGANLQAPEKVQTANSKPQIPVKPQGSSPKLSAGILERAGWMGRLVAKMKGLFEREPKTTRPIPQPVQGELSLENVKVMRNDLSDSDFEVVTKPAASQKPTVQKRAVKALEQGTPKAAPADSRKIWNRVTTLIGAGHS